jgi:hypothetical protein
VKAACKTFRGELIEECLPRASPEVAAFNEKQMGEVLWCNILYTVSVMRKYFLQTEAAYDMW